jgi:hypothetical protein
VSGHPLHPWLCTDEKPVGTENLPTNERVRGFCVPRTLRPFSDCPLPALAQSSSDSPTPGGYTAQCPVPVLQVLGSSVQWGLEPQSAAPAPPGRLA